METFNTTKRNHGQEIIHVVFVSASQFVRRILSEAAVDRIFDKLHFVW